MEKLIDEMITKYQNIEDNYESNPNLDCHERGVEAGKADLSWRVVEDLEQLKSSLPKPVEVPEFIKNTMEEYDSLQEMLTEEYYSELSEEVDDDTVQCWIDDNFDLLCSAWIYGYTVIKEPLYYMPVPYLDETYYVINESGMDVAYGIGDKFLGSELDKYFPDIKKLAVTVEETPKLPQEIEVSEYLEDAE